MFFDESNIECCKCLIMSTDCLRIATKLVTRILSELVPWGDVVASRKTSEVVNHILSAELESCCFQSS
jgi:hypothetical protein